MQQPDPGGYPPPQQQQPFAPPQYQPPQQQFGAPPPFQQQQQPPAYNPQAPYGAPPQPYGHAPQAVCAQGHEIPPGASYCAMGHPIAVQGPPHDAYQGQGFAPAAPPPQQAFGGQPAFGQPPAPPPAPAPFGVAQTEAPPPGVQPGPQALRGFLVSFQTNQNGDFWPLKGGRITIGRAQSVDGLDIALPDATISSRHAAMHVDGIAGTVAVEDTGSTNGTYVNEEHIGLNGRRDLRDGDKVRFGGYTTIVKIVSRV
jgi:hypothetical protein